MVSLLDEAVGNLTSALRRLNLLDDTIIFFTSDVSVIYLNVKGFIFPELIFKRMVERSMRVPTMAISGAAK